MNISHALKSVVGWADRVYVVDSFSTDETKKIAEEMGATVVEQEWLGYARQKNWALDTLPFESDWVFILDADEWLSAELGEELRQIASKPVGEWNESRILAQGNHVEHWLNGVKLLEYQLWSTEWREKVAATKFAAWPGYGLSGRGHIAIQGDHAGELSLRNIRIRPG